ncbi:MAG: dihydropteroate synthase [Alphaproteobacteria bacterium]
MSFSKPKYYLRPFGRIDKTRGKILARQGKVLEVQNIYFSFVEVIKKTKSISRKIHTIPDFRKLLTKCKEYQELYEKLNYKNTKLEKLLFNKSNYSIFGILNITPDSFSDGGVNSNIDNAIKNAHQMIKDGARFIDIGGESTRPGAKKIDPHIEINRVLPVLQLLKSKNINISLDTRNSSTMEFGIILGAQIINDVSGLDHDKESIKIINRYNVPVILMHMPGNPKTMMKNNKYKDVTTEVYDFLEAKIKKIEEKGINKENIIIDPGIGFGKNYKQNLQLLNNLSIFHGLGVPLMLGVSRKRFIDAISKESDPKKRVGGTVSATLCALNQGIKIHRVHDVKIINQAIKVFEKLNH